MAIRAVKEGGNDAAYQVYLLLRTGFTIAPILFGGHVLEASRSQLAELLDELEGISLAA